MRVAGRRLLPLLSLTSVLVAVVAAVPAAATGPAAALTLPGGPAVTGTVTVDVSGQVSASGTDTVKSLTLYVDGAASGGSYSCDGGQKSCSAALSWDSTGLSGVHTLVVKLLSADNASASSSATPVVVTSPLPTAAVTSPTVGAEVAGFVSVTGSAAVDASQSDTARTLQFYVDGVYNAQKSCSGGDPGACSATFSWDTTSLYGLHSLQVRFRTANGLSVMSPAVGVQVGAAPSAAITSPATGATVTGIVTVRGSGSVDGLQPDSLKSLQLLVDGAAGASATCSAASTRACTAALAWDSTGAAGQHQLQVKVTTSKGQTALSPVTSVVADNPGPAVVLTPAATVSGVASIKVRGTVDASQSDAGAFVRLLADGRSVGTAPCPAASKTCAVSVSWSSSGLSGPHSLQAQFTTTGGRTASSAVSTVWVLSDVRVSAVRPAQLGAGQAGTVTGRVVAIDGTPAAGVRVRVLVQNSLGRPPADVTVTTTATGAYAATYQAVSNAVVTVSVAASAHYGAGTAKTTAAVSADPSCTAKATVTRGAADPVVCRLGDLPRGTSLTLQVQQGGIWRTARSARSTGPTWAVAQAFATKGTVWLRLAVAASKDFMGASSAPVKVTVR